MRQMSDALQSAKRKFLLIRIKVFAFDINILLAHPSFSDGSSLKSTLICGKIYEHAEKKMISPEKKKLRVIQ